MDMDAGEIKVYYDGVCKLTVPNIDCSEPLYPFANLDYTPEQVTFVPVELD